MTLSYHREGAPVVKMAKLFRFTSCERGYQEFLRVTRVSHLVSHWPNVEKGETWFLKPLGFHYEHYSALHV